MQLWVAGARITLCAVFVVVAWSVRGAESAYDLLGSDAAAYVRSLSERTSTLPATPASEASPDTNAVGTASGALKANTLTSMDALDDKHRLGVGDRLSLRIIEDREDAKELFVTDSGEIDVPYIGRVAAKGRTCKEVAAEVKVLLEKEYYHQATPILAIDLFSRSRGRVYVVGEVRVTGALEIPSNETFTVSKAILIAGGFTDFADKRKVKLTRRKGPDGTSAPPVVVDVSEILEKGRMEKDLELEPDDLVFVPARWLNF